MNLWIRSQDKTSLSDGVVNIYLYERYNSERGYSLKRVAFSDTKIVICLANYSTREKALKVLDMIENHLIIKQEVRDNEFVLRPITPFIMPQDNEVDV